MSKPIRVAQVLRWMNSGGVEAVVVDYWRHMDHGRVQFDFFFDESSSQPARSELKRGGAGLYPLPPYSRALEYQRRLTQALAKNRYRIAHVHLSTMSGFALLAAARAGVPVRICHNHTMASAREGVKTLTKMLLRPTAPLLATHDFACGETAGRWMYGNRRYDKGLVTLMPNAIDVRRFAYDPEARLRLRREMGFAPGAFVVGHVGRFVRQKNHGFLLEIFARVCALRPDAQLLLVGDRELEPQVRARVKAMGLEDRTVFTGARRDVDKLYSAMDVFCLPSLYEGMPLVAWEAQANGLPCFLSDVITPEAQLGGAAYLSLRDAPERWAQAILAGRRGPGANPPDIREEAMRLQAFYMQHANPGP